MGVKRPPVGIMWKLGEVVPAQASSLSLDHGSKLPDPSPIAFVQLYSGIGLDYWIGRRGPVLWPLRSPDLIQLDFFPVGQSEGIGVPRRRGHTSGLSCLSACCLYFDGHRDAATLIVANGEY
ncbi:uncharacterized protein TNCV_1712241 [Trichonephila clavipes]|nr:uncharacterized protein TNCV_1712241 [Trichonephila clavipes]